jgi:hypothetical protein
MHASTSVVERHASTRIYGRFGFIAMLLSFLMFAAGSAHADPYLANTYLQQAKGNLTITKVYYQYGRISADARNLTAARSYFISAHGQTLAMVNNATYLYAQNSQTLGARRCRNISAQQAAVQYSSLLQQQSQSLSYNMNILISVPNSISIRYYVETSLNQISSTLLNIEQLMTLAQCY